MSTEGLVRAVCWTPGKCCSTCSDHAPLCKIQAPPHQLRKCHSMHLDHAKYNVCHVNGVWTVSFFCSLSPTLSPHFPANGAILQGMASSWMPQQMLFQLKLYATSNPDGLQWYISFLQCCLLIIRSSIIDCLFTAWILYPTQCIFSMPCLISAIQQYPMI